MTPSLRNLPSRFGRGLSRAAGIGLITAIGFASAPAEAVSPEARRLMENMDSLAEKNAWTGVDRNYGLLMELGEDVPFKYHMLGAEAASTQGMTYERYVRLQAAIAVQADAEVQSSVDAIVAQYCLIDLKGKERLHPKLVVQSMPFAPDQRRSIEYAQTFLEGAGSFKGMLPIGTYGVGTHEFTCEGNAGEWMEFKLTPKDLFEHTFDGSAPPPPSGGDEPVANGDGGKQKPPPKPKPAQGEIERIIYVGPIATGGFGLTSSGDPGTAYPTLSVQPDAMTRAGVSFEAGGEVGLSYKFGVAAVLGYRGGYGGDGLHDMNASLLAAIRPGDLRITVGPTWGIVRGIGVGVADHSEPDGYNAATDPRTKAELKYAGWSWGGGVSAGVGYGLLDFGKMQGVVEAAGSFRYDSTRPWVGAGLRVGIVPKVPRFEG